MVENKTKATDVSAEDYIDAISDEAKRTDCQNLVKIMRKVTGHEPKMWGPTMIGFGSYHYQYQSGRQGDSCLVSFASRKTELCVYLINDWPERDVLLAKLGTHKIAKACVYIKRLSDVDTDVLAQLIAASVAEVKHRHP